MNLASVAAGLVFTAGLTSYSTMQLENTLKAVNEIDYEPTEPITPETGLRNAIDIVRRNDIKRRDLALRLHNALKESLKAEEN